MLKQLLMFRYGDTSQNLLGIVIYIKVTISAWTISRRPQYCLWWFIDEVTSVAIAALLSLISLNMLSRPVKPGTSHFTYHIARHVARDTWQNERPAAMFTICISEPSSEIHEEKYIYDLKVRLQISLESTFLSWLRQCQIMKKFLFMFTMFYVNYCTAVSCGVVLNVLFPVSGICLFGLLFIVFFPLIN